MDQATKPFAVLNNERAVDSQLFVELSNLILGCVHTEDCAGDVTGVVAPTSPGPSAAPGVAAPRPLRRRWPSSVTWLRLAAIAGGIGLLALFAPALWMAVAGGMGLVVLGLLLALAYSVVQALPWLGQRLENQLLAARKAEARRNPIEQLQNELLRRAQRLKAFRDALVVVGGQVETISQILAARRHRDPQHELDRQERALARLQQFHALNIARLQQAQAALDDFRAAIERKESEWRIALAIEKSTALPSARICCVLLP